jgi:3-oxoacyl-[acyl-carrier protein] reductase
MDLRLSGKVALVTAASRGLGKAAAWALAGEGARVALCARSDQIHAAAREIQADTGSQVLAVQADVTRREDVQRFVESAVARFGVIDVLVLNAGGPPPGSFLSLADETWQSAFDLTVMSAVRLCSAVLPRMLEQGSGCIIASQSYVVKQPLDNLVLSNALRMAVVGLMKSLANEFGPRGIRVNTINPGWTLTERVQELMADRAERSGGTPEGEVAKMAVGIPLRRMAAAEEYGRAVAWLASPAASYVHGHALVVDGGLTQTPL